jgi:hypothetical protein
VFEFGPATRIYVAADAADMRENFNGLYDLVRDHLGCDPESGGLAPGTRDCMANSPVGWDCAPESLKSCGSGCTVSLPASNDVVLHDRQKMVETLLQLKQGPAPEEVHASPDATKQSSVRIKRYRNE